MLKWTRRHFTSSPDLQNCIPVFNDNTTETTNTAGTCVLPQLIVDPRSLLPQRTTPHNRCPSQLTTNLQPLTTSPLLLGNPDPQPFSQLSIDPQPFSQLSIDPQPEVPQVTPDHQPLPLQLTATFLSLPTHLSTDPRSSSHDLQSVDQVMTDTSDRTRTSNLELPRSQVVTDSRDRVRMSKNERLRSQVMTDPRDTMRMCNIELPRSQVMTDPRDRVRMCNMELPRSQVMIDPRDRVRMCNMELPRSQVMIDPRDRVRMSNMDLSNQRPQHLPLGASKGSITPVGEGVLSVCPNENPHSAFISSNPRLEDISKHARSRSLPASPQKSLASAQAPDTRKKTGVLSKFKNFFKKGTSVKKKGMSAPSSPSSLKTTPTGTRRSRSPIRMLEGRQERDGTVLNTRLTRLIESKRDERKFNTGVQKSVDRSLSLAAYKMGPSTQSEYHNYERHSNIDRSLVAQDRNRVLARDFDPAAPISTTRTFQQNRAVELQQDIRNSNIVADSPVARGTGDRMPPYCRTPGEEEESLLTFGESLLGMVESGSYHKVKVMPSLPDSIILARDLLSPVHRRNPSESNSFNPERALSENSGNLRWSMSLDGSMVLTSDTGAEVTDKADTHLLTFKDVNLPKNNNNGHGNTSHDVLHGYSDIVSKSDLNRIEFTQEIVERQSFMMTEPGGRCQPAVEFSSVCAPTFTCIPKTIPESDSASDVRRLCVRDIVKSFEGQHDRTLSQKCHEIENASGGQNDSPQSVELLVSYTNMDESSEEVDESPSLPFRKRQETEAITIEQHTRTPVLQQSLLREGSVNESEGFWPNKLCSFEDTRLHSFEATIKESHKLDAANPALNCKQDGSVSVQAEPQENVCSVITLGISSVNTDLDNDTWMHSIEEDLTTNSNLDSLVSHIEQADCKLKNKLTTTNFESKAGVQQYSCTNDDFDLTLNEEIEAHQISVEIMNEARSYIEFKPDSMKNCCGMETSLSSQLFVVNSQLEDSLTKSVEPMPHISQVEQMFFIPQIEQPPHILQVEHMLHIPQVEQLLDIPQVEQTPHNPQVEKSPNIPQVEQLNHIRKLEHIPQVEQMPHIPQVEQIPHIQQVEQTPHTPQVGKTPHILRIEQTPHIPQVERTPHAPQVEQTPQIPQVEQTPQIPQVEQTPHIPQVEQTPQIPHDDQMSHISQVEQTLHIPQDKQTPQILQVEEMPHIPKVEQMLHILNVERMPHIPQVEQIPLIPLAEQTPEIPQVEQMLHIPQVEIMMSLIPQVEQISRISQVEQMSHIELLAVECKDDVYNRSVLAVGTKVVPRSKLQTLTETTVETEPLTFSSHAPILIASSNLEESFWTSKGAQEEFDGPCSVHNENVTRVTPETELYLEDLTRVKAQAQFSPLPTAGRLSVLDREQAKDELVVKPKKKVSFSVDIPDVDSVSSHSEAAVIETTPVLTTTLSRQEQGPVETADLGSDNASSTDASYSFSLKSMEARTSPTPAHSVSVDDVSWWATDTVDEISFFHDHAWPDHSEKARTDSQTSTDGDIAIKDSAKMAALYEVGNSPYVEPETMEKTDLITDLLTVIDTEAAVSNEHKVDSWLLQRQTPPAEGVDSSTSLSAGRINTTDDPSPVGTFPANKQTSSDSPPFMSREAVEVACQNEEDLQSKLANENYFIYDISLTNTRDFKSVTDTDTRTKAVPNSLKRFPQNQSPWWGTSPRPTSEDRSCQVEEENIEVGGFYCLPDLAPQAPLSIASFNFETHISPPQSVPLLLLESVETNSIKKVEKKQKLPCKQLHSLYAEKLSEDSNSVSSTFKDPSPRKTSTPPSMLTSPPEFSDFSHWSCPLQSSPSEMLPQQSSPPKPMPQQLSQLNRPPGEALPPHTRRHSDRTSGFLAKRRLYLYEKMKRDRKLLRLANKITAVSRRGLGERMQKAARLRSVNSTKQDLGRTASGSQIKAIDDDSLVTENKVGTNRTGLQSHHVARNSMTRCGRVPDESNDRSGDCWQSSEDNLDYADTGLSLDRKAANPAPGHCRLSCGLPSRVDPKLNALDNYDDHDSVRGTDCLKFNKVMSQIVENQYVEVQLDVDTKDVVIESEELPIRSASPMFIQKAWKNNAQVKNYKKTNRLSLRHKVCGQNLETSHSRSRFYRDECQQGQFRGKRYLSLNIACSTSDLDDPRFSQPEKVRNLRSFSLKPCCPTFDTSSIPNHAHFFSLCNPNIRSISQNKELMPASQVFTPALYQMTGGQTGHSSGMTPSYLKPTSGRNRKSGSTRKFQSSCVGVQCSATDCHGPSKCTKLGQATHLCNLRHCPCSSDGPGPSLVEDPSHVLTDSSYDESLSENDKGRAGEPRPKGHQHLRSEPDPGQIKLEETQVKPRPLDFRPEQWAFIATFFLFQLVLHWLYAR